VAATYEILEAVETVVACELLTAVRAIRNSSAITVGSGVQEVLHSCAELSHEMGDRVLVDDVDTARAVLGSLAAHYSARL